MFLDTEFVSFEASDAAAEQKRKVVRQIQRVQHAIVKMEVAIDHKRIESGIIGLN